MPLVGLTGLFSYDDYYLRLDMYENRAWVFWSSPHYHHDLSSLFRVQIHKFMLALSTSMRLIAVALRLSSSSDILDHDGPHPVS